VRVFEEILGPNSVVAADNNEDALTHFRRRFPHVKSVNSFDEALAVPSIEAVVQATPASRHAALVESALTAGRHVLCEKPFMTNLHDAERLARLACVVNRTVFIAHMFMFNSGLRHVREQYLVGGLGALRYASATRTNLGPIRTDVDVVADLASHDVAIMNLITQSSPVIISAVEASYIVPNHADAIFATLRYENGFVASLHAIWFHSETVRRTVFVGSERMLKWDDLDLESPVTIYDKHVESHISVSNYGDFLRVSTHTGEIRRPHVAFTELLRAQAISFLNSIELGSPNDGDAECAVEVTRVLTRSDFQLETAD
jgi:predicted dehydrogenase